MIIKHQGITMDGGEVVIGYAVCMEDKSYIYLENGRRVHVRRTSVLPVQETFQKDNSTQQKLQHYGKHSLQYLKLGELVIANLRQKGALYLEDLEGWTDSDYQKIRGLGVKKQTTIQKTMELLNLRYSGTDYLNT